MLVLAEIARTELNLINSILVIYLSLILPIWFGTDEFTGVGPPVLRYVIVECNSFQYTVVHIHVIGLWGL